MTRDELIVRGQRLARERAALEQRGLAAKKALDRYQTPELGKRVEELRSSYAEVNRQLLDTRTEYAKRFVKQAAPSNELRPWTAEDTAAEEAFERAEQAMEDARDNQSHLDYMNRDDRWDEDVPSNDEQDDLYLARQRARRRDRLSNGQRARTSL